MTRTPSNAITAQLSCHVENFVAVTLWESMWEQTEIFIECNRYGPLWAHAPRMPRPPPPTPAGKRSRHASRHVRNACVPWCMPGLLTSGFLWSRWRGKRSRHSRRMHKPQFYVSGKRPMENPLVNWYFLILDRHPVTVNHMLSIQWWWQEMMQSEHTCIWIL